MAHVEYDTYKEYNITCPKINDRAKVPIMKKLVRDVYGVNNAIKLCEIMATNVETFKFRYQDIILVIIPLLNNLMVDKFEVKMINEIKKYIELLKKINKRSHRKFANFERGLVLLLENIHYCLGRELSKSFGITSDDLYGQY